MYNELLTIECSRRIKQLLVNWSDKKDPGFSSRLDI